MASTTEAWRSMVIPLSLTVKKHPGWNGGFLSVGGPDPCLGIIHLLRDVLLQATAATVATAFSANQQACHACIIGSAAASLQQSPTQLV